MSTYNFEFAEEEKIRVGYLGCGGHSYRNVYPCFQYAPTDLMAVCDLNEERARHYARQFGARRHFTDYQEMLSECELDAVFVVTGYDKRDRKTNHGTWSRLPDRPDTIQIRWDVGRWVDTFTFSVDCTTLTGKNNAGTAIRAVKGRN